VHAFVGNFGDELSVEARAALKRVDTLLSAMSGKAFPDLWTEQAVCEHSRWADVRAAARDALDALGWDAV